MIFLVVGLLSTMMAAAQINNTRDYYLTKSKNQKTIGWILAGSVAGLIVGDQDNSNNGSNNSGLDLGPNFDVGLWLVGGGIAAGLASIPFFISSRKNARKAGAIGLSNQKIVMPQGSAFTTKMQPTVSLKIPL